MGPVGAITEVVSCDGFIDHLMMVFSTTFLVHFGKVSPIFCSNFVHFCRCITIYILICSLPALKVYVNSLLSNGYIVPLEYNYYTYFSNYCLIN